MGGLLVNLSVVFSQPTGISNYATNLFPVLRGLNPILLSSQDYSGFECFSIPGDMTPAQGSRGHFKRLLWTQLELPKIYKNRDSKLLFSPIPEAPIYSHCRYIVQVHDLIPLRFPKFYSPLTQYFRYYVPQVLKQAQHIICNSQSTADDIVRFYQVPVSKITPILLGYDANHFCPTVKSEGELATQKNPYFLYLGRHDPYKNLPRLITGFAALVKNHPSADVREYELWLVGSTDKRFTPILESQIRELGITEQVKFLNYVAYDYLPILIQNAIALVFPSLWEGFGFPVLEAMGCGTPVITSNLSSLPEVAGDAAILINPYNTQEITDAMLKIAVDGEMRSHLSQLGLKQAKNFSWEKTGEATAEVLKMFM
ncbi:glycosyltransferase family 4 protein [Calothrix sp. PCC 6303]|uniref:glycosyltransferase family 4 protein n=1 Tax=Calothrix sp. PCC 6303 TaxID=1170562 RepID=UPI0002A01E20|nr:glycosyltransferase family 1 protein [Calothrix sp. PCC 6303]AFY99626.1 glycosyl transferase group 1 [Calothrix sp. PCC 6303]